jgi:hypothetical protein
MGDVHGEWICPAGERGRERGTDQYENVVLLGREWLVLRFPRKRLISLVHFREIAGSGCYTLSNEAL